MTAVLGILKDVWDFGGTQGLSAVGGIVAGWYLRRLKYPEIKAEVAKVESELPGL